jgi:hypothetical protein
VSLASVCDNTESQTPTRSSLIICRPNIIHQTLPQKNKLAINTVFRPSVKPDTEIYSPYGVNEWKLPDALQRTKPLGKSLCVLDLDSRPLDGEGQVFGPLPLSFDIANKISGPSLGTLQHWLYGTLGPSLHSVGQS